MTYLVTARKWRPMVFEDVVGQSHVTTTLKNAIGTSRLSHAYLFSGPRGVGKTTTARILAKAVNCLHIQGANPDNDCELCREITEGRSVNVFEIDGASNRGVDEIRNLRDAVRYAPARGAYKVYIIDEVHMLTKEAFNALLKTLEEPPSYIIFVFATTEVHKVPPTILSRCQRFDFRRIPLAEITARLKFIAREEHVTVDDEALFLIAKRGDGSMRDAQSIFDQVVSFSGDTIRAEDVRSMLNVVNDEFFFRATDAIRSKDARAGLRLVDDVVCSGFDVRDFLDGLTEHIRNLLVTRSTGSATLIEASDDLRKRYYEDAKSFSETDLLRLLVIAADTDTALRWSQSGTGGRIRLELGLLQMIKLDSSVDIGALLHQLDELKNNLNRGIAQVDDELPFPKPPAEQELPTSVRGTVKASPPTLRPDQIVSAAEPPPTYGVPPATGNERIAAQLSDPLPGVSAKTLSPGYAMEKWSSLVDEARRQHTPGFKALAEAHLIGVNGNQLRIGCPDDFHLDALKRNRQFLSEIARKVYGAKVHLDAILSSTQIRLATGQLAVPSEGGDGIRSHPVVQALVREFGASEIE